MTRRELWIVLLLVAALAGCAKVGPDYVPPAASGPAEWQSGKDAQDGQGQGGGAAVSPEPLRADWWTAFGDPAMDALVRRAAAQNLGLQAAAARVYAARAQLAVAVGNLYPQRQQLAGDVTYQRVSANSAQGVALGGVGLDGWSDQLGLTASWELDVWGRFRRGVESARAGLEGSLAGYDDALVSLAAETARTYTLMRTFEDRLGIARRNLELQRESLRIAEARFRFGATSERDVQQARTQLLSTQAGIPGLEAGLSQSRHALCALLGLPPEGAAELAPTLAGSNGIPAAPDRAAIGIPADLLRRRPDIRRAERAAAAQCALVGVAKADMYPAFSLTGSIGLASSTAGGAELGDITQGQSRTALFSPGFRWNILNYGRLTNAVRAQDARFQELLLAYRDGVLQALREAEDFLTGYLRSRERAALLAQSAEAAERSLRLAVVQYAEGATDFTTVLTAQQALLAQQDGLATVRGESAQNFIGLYRALGGGWELRQGRELLPAAVRDEMRARTSWGGLLDEDPASWQAGGVPARQ